MNRIVARISPAVAMVAAGLVLSGGGAVTVPGQPQVNNPPEIVEFGISFGTKAGHLIGIDTNSPTACTRVQVNFGTTVKDWEGDPVTVTMDLDGDKKLDDFKKTVKGEGTVVGKKTYKTLGKVEIRYRACDKPGLCSSMLEAWFDVVKCPPEFVSILTDTRKGDLDKTAVMTMTARDVQDDKVRYEVDWDDDGTFETVTAPSVPSKSVKIEHTFTDNLMHVVSLRVCDTLDGCSETDTRKF